MCDVLDDIHNEASIEKIKQQVVTLCRAFPVYVDQTVDDIKSRTT
jgi:glycine hydroxymethyltransferase